MATAPVRKSCITCGKDRATLRCGGCLQEFCSKHLQEHQQHLSRQLDEIEISRDLFRQTLTEQTTDLQNHALIREINDWERKSIKIIRQTAEESREVLHRHMAEEIEKIEIKLNSLTKQLQQSREENDFDETYLNYWNEELTKLTKELSKPSNINLRQTSTPLIYKLCLDTTSASNQQINVEKKTSISKPLKRLPLKVDLDRSVKREINILLLGLTGVGRSTFINAFANYLLNDTLEQAVNDNIQVLIPFKFPYTNHDTLEEQKIVYGKEDQYERMENPGETGTRACRSFVFTIGDRLLRLIDTPPVGDTRGIFQDIQNFDEIMTYIAQYKHLNGICIFLKPNEEQVTFVSQFCIAELFRHIPKSAMANIMFVFTNIRSTFFVPGSSFAILRELFNEYHQSYNIQVPFTRENTFLVDNEGFRYLAKRHNGIQLGSEHTEGCIKSWNHTVKEYVRLIAHVATRPAHNVHDTVSLNEVQQLIRKLSRIIHMLPYLSQISERKNNPMDEKGKIEDAYRKLCRFLQDKSILPFNEHSPKYIGYFIREEEKENERGVQNHDVIKGLKDLQSELQNEIILIKKILESEGSSGKKTDLIEAKDVFPLLATLYDLPITGHEIRKQVEQFKINQNNIPQREIFVQLPAKANSSQMMLQLIDCLAKS